LLFIIIFVDFLSRFFQLDFGAHLFLLFILSSYLRFRLVCYCLKACLKVFVPFSGSCVDQITYQIATTSSVTIKETENQNEDKHLIFEDGKDLPLKEMVNKEEELEQEVNYENKEEVGGEEEDDEDEEDEENEEELKDDSSAPL